MEDWCCGNMRAQVRSPVRAISSPGRLGAFGQVIGTTSRPDSVEPALRRSGRFDREIAMGMPDRAVIGLYHTLGLSMGFSSGPCDDIEDCHQWHEFS